MPMRRVVELNPQVPVYRCCSRPGPCHVSKPLRRRPAIGPSRKRMHRGSPWCVIGPRPWKSNVGPGPGRFSPLKWYRGHTILAWDDGGDPWSTSWPFLCVCGSAAVIGSSFTICILTHLPAADAAACCCRSPPATGYMLHATRLTALQCDRLHHVPCSKPSSSSLPAKVPELSASSPNPVI